MGGLTFSLFVLLSRFSQSSLHPVEIYLLFLSPPVFQTQIKTISIQQLTFPNYNYLMHDIWDFAVGSYDNGDTKLKFNAHLLIQKIFHTHLLCLSHCCRFHLRFPLVCYEE